MPPTEGLTDGKAAIPLYQQVIDIIKNEINSGAYKAGARIPNEFELAESYKVGRVTVRRAIEELVQQGYLTKRQGKGTFVNAPKLKRKIRQKDDVQSFFGRMPRKRNGTGGACHFEKDTAGGFHRSTVLWCSRWN